MIDARQKEKARAFQDLHQREAMFVLPNAWDVGSAYVFQKQGFKAVATSSAGIAYDLGYPDGEDIAFADLVWIVAKIAGRIDVPLSVDFERGYGETAEAVRENARKLLFAGAVGFNIEDGLSDGTLSPLALQIEKIQALAALKRELGIDFVINARTCAYWLDVADAEGKLRIACERGNAFVKAGADCVFVPGAVDETTVGQLVAGIDAPINIILNKAFSDFARLEAIGVRRLSVGSAPVRYVYDKTIEMANSLFHGNTTELLANAFTYGRANDYFASE